MASEYRDGIAHPIYSPLYKSKRTRYTVIKLAWLNIDVNPIFYIITFSKLLLLHIVNQPIFTRVSYKTSCFVAAVFLPVCYTFAKNLPYSIIAWLC